MEKVAQKVEIHGIEAWFNSNDRMFLDDALEEYEKNNDILDVWFDSGVSNF